MSSRTLHLGLLILLTAAAIAVAWCSPAYERAPAPTRARTTLGFVPAGAELVVTVDVERLRATTLGRLLTAEGRQLPEVGLLEQVCGFDPTERIQDLVVAVPGPGAPSATRGDFGIVVVGNFEASRIVGCAASVVKQRGGDPAVTPIGSFTAIRDRIHPSRGEVAVRDGGPAVLGSGEYLRVLVDIAEGRGRSEGDAGLHGELRRAADPGGDGAIVATWQPSPGRFDALDPRTRRVWMNVAGLGVRVGVSPDLELRVLVVCAQQAGCHDVTEAVRALRSRLALPARELLGIDLDDVSIRPQPGQVELVLHLSAKEAEAFVERLLRAGLDTPQ